MRRIKIYTVIFLLLLIAAFFAFQYIFSVYEVVIDIDPKELYADNTSTSIIKIIPINAFGWKAPFRKSSAEFDIKEGESLIDVVSINNEEGFIIIKAKNDTGKVIIFVKAEYALLPTPVEIPIYPNVVEKF